MILRPPHRLTPLAALLLAAGAFAAPEEQALDRWSLCPTQPPAREIPRVGDESTQLTADQARAEGEERSIFTGDVVVIRDGRRLETDRAVYDKGSDTLDAEGNVGYFSEAISLAGDNARLRLSDETGYINSARYRIDSAHAFGTAQRVDFLSKEYSELHTATYTTCPPGHEDWLLEADELTLDRATNTGEAWDVTLELSGVPVMYLPYMNFPLAGRKSGFLVPTYGNSERNGTDLSVPWYWNIAPDRDATLTPRLISNRGGMLMSEFRYLNESGSGELNADVLPDDQLYDGETRSYVRYRHSQRLGAGWRATVLYQEVSDTNYLTDIDSTIASSSVNYLERKAELRYGAESWTFLGRVQDFQTLDGRENYQRRPQLQITGGDSAGPFEYDYQTEYAYFASNDKEPVGSRIDIYPGISLPVRSSGGYLTPRVAARHTQYDLEGAAGDPAPSRTLPIASLDSGLVFERELSLFKTPLVQTLEPRLYYLHVPFEDQSDLPNFDTTTTTFSFDQLFRENRFIGADRMGDADQVTVGLTSRLLRDDTGAETVRASIGQVHYFSDREVTLSGTPQTRGYSDLAGELAVRPVESIELSAATRWDPEVEDAKQSTARARYRPDPRRLLDASWNYNVTGAGIEASRDLLAYWPLSAHWQFVGRWYYDLVNERTLESVVGVQYESCCWAVRLVTRDQPFLDDNDKLQSDRSIYLTLELKGLGSIGESLADAISDNDKFGLE